MTTRPLTIEEYEKTMELLRGGFISSDQNKKDDEKIEFLRARQKVAPEKRTYKVRVDLNQVRPNKKIALALQLQASLGLRIGDVLNLQVKSLSKGKLETKEKKTGKLQYRDISPAITELVMEYALENGLKKESKLFDISVRTVQNHLQKVVDHLGLENISTHSFRKMFANHVYEQSNNNVDLLKELLNHSSVSITQKYIKTTQEAINKVSSSINFCF